MSPEISRADAAAKVREATAAFVALGTHPGLTQHNHTLDAHGRKVLLRLHRTSRNSDKWTAAQSILKAVPQARFELLFVDCIIAEFRSRMHVEWKQYARSAIESAPDARKALKLVRGYLERPVKAPKDSYLEVGQSADPVDEALGILSAAIDWKLRSAIDHDNISSRKTTPAAARVEGIGVIKASLIRISERYGGSADPQHVAAIASAALGMGEVTIDAARKAPSADAKYVERRDGAFATKKPSQRAAQIRQ